jgi:hypothetical protein
MVDGCWLMVVRRRFFFASLIRMTHIVMEYWSTGVLENPPEFQFTNLPNSTTSTNSLDAGCWFLGDG